MGCDQLFEVITPAMQIARMQTFNRGNTHSYKWFIFHTALSHALTNWQSIAYFELKSMNKLLPGTVEWQRDYCGLTIKGEHCT